MAEFVSMLGNMWSYPFSNVDSHVWSGLSRLKVDSQRYECDLSDWLNYSCSTIILILFALIISARQYIGKPISCWVPTEFTRSQEEYAESVCWVTSTYFLPNSTISHEKEGRNIMKLTYYQWVPFILMAQAALFYIPCLIWRMFNWQSGYQITRISELSRHLQICINSQDRHYNIVLLAMHLNDIFKTRLTFQGNGFVTKVKKCINSVFCFWFGKRFGNFLVGLYLLVKFLYSLNIFGQLILMNTYLGTNYTLYGIHLLLDISSGRSWQESGNFPRVTICDFTIHKLANTHRYTVQCVLPINMFNEKIYIFLWFWMVLVSIKTVQSFVTWSLKLIMVDYKVGFIQHYLRYRNIITCHELDDVRYFVTQYLRSDGVFVLRIVKAIAGEIVCGELVEEIWKIYIQPHRHSNVKRESNAHQLLTGKEKDNPSIPFIDTRLDKSQNRFGFLSNSISAKSDISYKNRFNFKSLTKPYPIQSSNHDEEEEGGDFV